MTGGIAWFERMAFLAAHPVGGYFWTSNSENPGNKYGGEWEQIKDVFLLAAGSIHPAGSVGGEEKHTLTQVELPAHQHGYNLQGGPETSHQTALLPWTEGISWQKWYTESFGNTEPHNNMPPYLAAYCWRRVA